MCDYPQLPSLCFFTLSFPTVTQKKLQKTQSAGKEEDWKTRTGDAKGEAEGVSVVIVGIKQALQTEGSKAIPSWQQQRFHTWQPLTDLKAKFILFDDLTLDARHRRPNNNAPMNKTTAFATVRSQDDAFIVSADTQEAQRP